MTKRLGVPAVLAAGVLVAFLTISAAIADQRGSRWNIDVDTSSLEDLLLHPEAILAAPDSFWAADGAYVLSRKWHESVGVPLDNKGYYDRWLARLRELAAVPAEDRSSQDGFHLLQELRDRIPRYQAEALELNDTFLPRNGLTFTSTIHVTTGTYAFGFMTHTQIVVDPLSAHYGADPDRIFNLLTHEAYHIGFGINRSLRQETDLDDGFVYNTMLDGLQNEGLATYVGYSARAVFPNDDEPDYALLDDPAEARSRRDALNALFSLVGTVPTDSLKQVAWKIGVEDRAYYITGAHMARTIDRELGRDALIRTIAVGPLEFVDVYNGIVGEDERIVTFARPRGPDALRDLKAAAIAGDQPGFAAARAELERNRDTLPAATRRRLERFGYGLIATGAHDRAIDVFLVDVSLFPQEPNAHDSLGEAYLKSGDTDNARRCYRQALAVDPGFTNARRMLDQIGG